MNFIKMNLINLIYIHFFIMDYKVNMVKKDNKNYKNINKNYLNDIIDMKNYKRKQKNIFKIYQKILQIYMKCMLQQIIQIIILQKGIGKICVEIQLQLKNIKK